jgi:hypothetical protein
MSSEKEPGEQRQGKRYRVRGDAVVIFGTPEVGTGLLIGFFSQLVGESLIDFQCKVA